VTDGTRFTDGGLLFRDGEIAEAPEKIVTDAVAIYNRIAKSLNGRGIVWCEAKALTDKRRKKIKGAIRDYGGLRGWEECLERASKNRFLLGKEGRSATHKNWKPELDFFLQEKTVLRLVEGGYPADDYDEKAKVVLPTVMRKGQEALKPFVTTETLEDRYRASIASYTKLGRFADANRIEEKLAALENRPPVLVPAPDARNPDVMPGSRKSEPMRESGKATGMMGHNSRRGTVTDVSPADADRAKRAAMIAEPPPWTEVPEGEDFGGDE